MAIKAPSSSGMNKIQIVFHELFMTKRSKKDQLGGFIQELDNFVLKDEIKFQRSVNL